MKACAKCGTRIPTKTIIDGKVRVLSSRKRCLTCSPFGQHDTTSTKGSKTNKSSVCSVCGREYVVVRKSGHTSKKCNSCMSNRRRFSVKKRAVEYKGGKCSRCGYSKCPAALDFHHTDPSKKDFSLSGNHGRSWSSIQNELDKCVLLCKNCHAEEHYKNRDI